jgi:hypothetical protein
MNKEEFLEAFNSKTRDYEMFTKQGNRKCQAITKKAIKKVFGNKRITKDDLIVLLGKELAKAYKNEKTSEILDSEPPYHIKHYINKALVIVGYGFELDSYDVTDKVWDYVK